MIAFGPAAAGPAPFLGGHEMQPDRFVHLAILDDLDAGLPVRHGEAAALAAIFAPQAVAAASGMWIGLRHWVSVDRHETGELQVEFYEGEDDPRSVPDGVYSERYAAQWLGLLKPCLAAAAAEAHPQ
ncbi:MAG: hypothetical protein AAF192_11925 [Pseudomonadota bacterium]